MAALSHGEDIEPIEGRMPCSRMVLESSGDTYCESNPRRVGAARPEKRCTSRRTPMQLDALSDN